MKQFNVNDQEWSELKCDQVAECFTGLHKDSYVELWTCEEGEEDSMPTISEKWERLSEAVQENIKIVLKDYPQCYWGEDDSSNEKMDNLREVKSSGCIDDKHECFDFDGSSKEAV